MLSIKRNDKHGSRFFDQVRIAHPVGKKWKILKHFPFTVQYVLDVDCWWIVSLIDCRSKGQLQKKKQNRRCLYWNFFFDRALKQSYHDVHTRKMLENLEVHVNSKHRPVQECFYRQNTRNILLTILVFCESGSGRARNFLKWSDLDKLSWIRTRILDNQLAYFLATLLRPAAKLLC